ncbi:hypothetical protein F4703DRAFT_1913136 [Phycomyces blakesleeanus]
MYLHPSPCSNLYTISSRFSLHSSMFSHISPRCFLFDLRSPFPLVEPKSLQISSISLRRHAHGPLLLCSNRRSPTLLSTNLPTNKNRTIRKFKPLDCDPLLPWILPNSRPRTHSTLGSPLHFVLKAVDHLPHKFDDVLTNLSTCLLLPLSSMVNTPAPSHPLCRPSWQDLKVNNLYQIDHNLNVPIPIVPVRPLPRSITLPRILQRLLEKLFLAHPIVFRACIPTFILESRHLNMPPRDVSPIAFTRFLSALVFGKAWARLSTRSYRMTCSHQHVHAQSFNPYLILEKVSTFTYVK